MLVALPGNTVPIPDSVHMPVIRLHVCTTALRRVPALCVSDATGEGQGEAPAVTLDGACGVKVQAEGPSQLRD